MYKFWGKVKKHRQRGKGLGFPTANINLTKKIPEGIYISQVRIKAKKYPSLTFIGKVKTFNEDKYQAEVYILDFNQDIYHQCISVKLIKKIRSNQKFNSSKDLIAQMKKDELDARKYFVRLFSTAKQ
ncbi:riboflavin kinase [Candidatus Daviesbacteria bacterium]|nr:riboflavin kinase [Candidatus Daviesbacteria bacterium]